MRLCAVALVLFAIASFAEAQETNTTRYSVSPAQVQTLAALRPSISSATPYVFHGRIDSDSNTAPAFSYLNVSFSSSKTYFRANAPLLSGRVYAESGAPSHLGIAFSNPSPVPVDLSFYFTDADGHDFGQGRFSIGAHEQIARFVREAPFNAPAGFRGTLTFQATAPIGVLAVLGDINEQGTFLMPNVPVIAAGANGTTVIPLFEDSLQLGSDGRAVTSMSRTDIVFVNTSDQTAAGTFTFSETVTIEGTTAATFRYAVPPRSSRRFRTTPSPGFVRSGFIQIVSDPASTLPSAFAVLSHTADTYTTQSTVPGELPATNFRFVSEGRICGGIFASVCGGLGAAADFTQVVVANPSDSATPVQLRKASGETVNFTVPARGQIRTSAFAGTGLGVAGITATSPVAAVALQANGSVPVHPTVREMFDMNAPEPSSLSLPHLVDEGGYTTNLFIFSGSESATASGTITTFSQTGDPVPLH